MKESVRLIEEYLLGQVPILTEMGVSIENYIDDTIILRAPLLPNKNHAMSAFAGSLYSVAAVTGWSMLAFNLDKHKLNCHIVLKSAEAKYKKPVKGDFESHCSLAESSGWDEFYKNLTEKGKGRLYLTVNIKHNSETCFIYKGLYVANLVEY